MMRKALSALVVVCIVAAVVMVAALIFGGRAGDFVPPPFDAAAQAGVPEAPADTGYEEIDARAFRFSAAGELTVRGGNVDIWLTNPEENTVWLKVRILDEKGNMLGESGLIRPGEYVRAVSLDTVPEKSVAVSLKIMAYEPDTYYSAGAARFNTFLTVAGK